MQVPVGAGNLHVLIDQSPKRGGHGRRFLVPHGRVADERQVQLELSGIVADKAEQVFGAALLLAFDHHGDRQRHLAGDGLEGAAGLDESHCLAFVVAGSARDDDLASIRQCFDARLEWRRLPQAQGIDRLHIVVPVKEHAWACGAVRLANHHRMTGGRAHGGLKTDRLEIGGNVLGSSAALILERGVG